jgi:4-aminobutyrate aminotransferase-like enzyme/Ser/Thr protein kinase RdoA (MazF antagonist)/murein DD-endopeptidase MepM/ murein hydrolase activator NlpD
MNSEYLNTQISTFDALKLAEEYYNLSGDITRLPGEIDFNFKIETNKSEYLLKVSRTNLDDGFLNFQQSILQHISNDSKVNISPTVLPNVKNEMSTVITDDNGNTRVLRLLSWISGRLWSKINPVSYELLYSLGKEAGRLTDSLQSFDHPFAHREFEWDIANVMWTSEFVDLFNDDRKKIINYFLGRLELLKPQYSELRKSVVHNDVNDNNIIVTEDLLTPEVRSIIDFGDAIYTQTINDLAITIAYAIMGKDDTLSASIPIIRGYNEVFSIHEEELEHLYLLVAARLIVSVTKSAINKQNEPDNSYLLISEKPAWEVLEKWIGIDESFATCSFRYACGLQPHPNESRFKDWSKNQNISLTNLFPTIGSNVVHPVNMSVNSTWLGHESEYIDNDVTAFKLRKLADKNSEAIIAGGYLEPRPIYVTEAYKTEGNNGSKYRSIHLGVDFWLPSGTPVHALFDGRVVIAVNEAGDKQYGGLVVLEHKIENLTFFTLYGHQSFDSISKYKQGDFISKGDIISHLGTPTENGNWASHLHFQIMLDLLGKEKEFPGVAYPDEVDIWKSICPDPNQLFKNKKLKSAEVFNDDELINYRNNHLGKSLSLSYSIPIRVARGSGIYLLDNLGRRYMDTVNNVAHVGHENSRVVDAGRNQLSVLNTNTRYLHENIVNFADELLKTFPEELCVVHFVNSGSEANELALRMSKAATGEKDIIAIEVGYHGNTSGCIDVSSYKFDGKGGEGAPEFTHIVPLPDSYRGLYRGDNTASKYVGHIQDQIDFIHSKDRNVAAFIAESIISCGGQIELPEGYLSLAYDKIKEAGGICIADEVQVGCGRVGKSYWGFQLHNVIPDIVTIGKPIGNGHPLAAVVCTREIAQKFANGMEYFNTFGGNPVSCAIGCEVLRVIKDDKLQDNALKTGNYLKEKLNSLKEEFKIIGEVRGQGLFLGFELVDDELNPLTKKTYYLANRMKELGILMSVDGKDNNVIKIKPPLVFSRENADELIFRLKRVLKEDYMIQ